MLAMPGAAGATTCTVMPSDSRAWARRKRKEPAASPARRGNEWARKSTRTRLTSFHGRVALGARILDAPPELAQLRALTGDLFAQQSGGEENRAEDETGLDDGPHGTDAD